MSQGRHPGGRLSGWWGRGTYRGQADWGVVLGQGTDLHLVRVGFLGDPGAVVTGVGWVGCSLKDPRLAREAWHPGQWAAGASKACPGGSVARTPGEANAAGPGREEGLGATAGARGKARTDARGARGKQCFQKGRMRPRVRVRWLHPEDHG